MQNFELDVPLETFRDVLNTIAVHDPDPVLAAAAERARTTMSGSAIMAVLSTASGSIYYPRLIAACVDWTRYRRAA